MGEIRALIIDDSAPMRRAIRDVLQGVPGCSIVGEGANGLEALQLAFAFRPDLIVLDINMPLMGGLEALRVLKGDLSSIHVVMASSILEPEVRDRALSLGADGCLQKGDQLWNGLRAIALNLSERPGSRTIPETEAKHGQ